MLCFYPHPCCLNAPFISERETLSFFISAMVKKVGLHTRCLGVLSMQWDGWPYHMVAHVTGPSFSIASCCFYWGKSPSFADVVYGFPSQSNYTLVHPIIIQHIHLIGLLGKKLLNIVASKKIVHILYIIGFHISQHVYIYIRCIYIYYCIYSITTTDGYYPF